MRWKQSVARPKHIGRQLRIDGHTDSRDFRSDSLTTESRPAFIMLWHYTQHRRHQRVRDPPRGGLSRPITRGIAHPIPLTTNCHPFSLNLIITSLPVPPSCSHGKKRGTRNIILPPLELDSVKMRKFYAMFQIPARTEAAKHVGNKRERHNERARLFALSRPRRMRTVCRR